jgi:NitT/TauT family transport system permease protein
MIFAFVGILAILMVWEFLVGGNSRANFLFSKPSSVGLAFGKGIINGPLLSDLASSGKATAISIVLGTSIAIFLVFFSRLWRGFARPTELILGLVATIPILAIAPMFLVWFGTGMTLKTSIATFVVTLISARELFLSSSDADQKWKSFLRLARASRWSSEFKIVVPTAVGALKNRAPEIVNIAFLGVFIGEFIASNEGLGYRVLRAGSLYQAELVLAAALLSVILLGALILISIMYFKAVYWITRSFGISKRLSK